MIFKEYVDNGEFTTVTTEQGDVRVYVSTTSCRRGQWVLNVHVDTIEDAIKCGCDPSTQSESKESRGQFDRTWLHWDSIKGTFDGEDCIINVSCLKTFEVTTDAYNLPESNYDALGQFIGRTPMR